MSKQKKQQRASREAAPQGSAKEKYFIPGNATDNHIEALVDRMIADEAAKTSLKANTIIGRAALAVTRKEGERQ